MKGKYERNIYQNILNNYLSNNTYKKFKGATKLVSITVFETKLFFLENILKETCFSDLIDSYLAAQCFVKFSIVFSYALAKLN